MHTKLRGDIFAPSVGERPQLDGRTLKKAAIQDAFRLLSASHKLLVPHASRYDALINDFVRMLIHPAPAQRTLSEVDVRIAQCGEIVRHSSDVFFSAIQFSLSTKPV